MNYTTNSTVYFPVKTYKEAITILDKVSTRILLTYSKHKIGVKDTVIRNFIARAIISLKGILKLYETGDYQDCWVIFRSNLDRLLYMVALSKSNTFELFDKWTFKKQYDFINKVKSDSDFKNKINPEILREVEEYREKYYNISRERHQWSKPNTSAVAREMGLLYLYKYGYDYASTIASPTATDGDEDYHRITDLPCKEFFSDQRVVLHYSCLIYTLLLEQGLNNSNLPWKKVMFEFIDNFNDFIKAGSSEYKTSFGKIDEMDPDEDLCESDK